MIAAARAPTLTLRGPSKEGSIMAQQSAFKKTRFEISAGRTHDAAIELVEAETVARQANVKRLRAARMKRDAKATEASEKARKPTKIAASKKKTATQPR